MWCKIFVVLIPPMKQMPEQKGSWRSATESVDDPFKQPEPQTSWALTGCKQPLFCAACEETTLGDRDSGSSPSDELKT